MPRRLVFLLVAGGILGGLALLYVRGVPEQEIAAAAHRGDRDAVARLLARDPSLAMAKVYPQGYEPWRTSPRGAGSRETRWDGRYLLHDVVSLGGDPDMLALLADAGADLGVRLDGRTLLHVAAGDANTQTAAWLLDRGAAVDDVNDCAAPCVERGQTALHEAAGRGDMETTEFLLTRGAAPGARAADGRTPLHLAAAADGVDAAWVLCRSGADPAALDAMNRTPRDVAGASPLPEGQRGALDYGPGAMTDWLAPGAGCDTLAARARATGGAVDEDEGRRVFADFLCRRGRQESCAAGR
ncbi:MAG: ankyrin repeat domain-containing protein [Vicinamibacterales bacterium]